LIFCGQKLFHVERNHHDVAMQLLLLPSLLQSAHSSGWCVLADELVMHIYCHFESGSCYFITILVLNALGRRSVTRSFTAFCLETRMWWLFV
jgi:hypothetical protein